METQLSTERTTGKSSSLCLSHLDTVAYTLGMWSGFRIDYDSLDIYFDSNDRVCRVCIIQH